MKNGPYIMVIAPADYPGKRYRGRYAYEHQVVWWQNTGEVVSSDFLIHHKNENKHDNAFSNLEKKARAEHTKEHATPAPMQTMVCDWCGEKFNRECRTIKYKIKIGQTKFYCCTSHQVKDQHRDKRGGS